MYMINAQAIRMSQNDVCKLLSENKRKFMEYSQMQIKRPLHRSPTCVHVTHTTLNSNYTVINSLVNITHNQVYKF